MAKVGRIDISFTAIRELMNSPEMEAEMKRRGEAVMEMAVARAPVAKEGSHRGRYKESFGIDSGVFGGIHHDRAWCEVSNDAPEALFVEYGNKGAEPYHILLKSLVEGGGD